MDAVKLGRNGQIAIPREVMKRLALKGAVARRLSRPSR